VEQDQQERSIDMAVYGAISKTSEYTVLFRYTFIPKLVQLFPTKELFLSVNCVRQKKALKSRFFFFMTLLFPIFSFINTILSSNNRRHAGPL